MAENRGKEGRKEKKQVPYISLMRLMLTEITAEMLLLSNQ